MFVCVCAHAYIYTINVLYLYMYLYRRGRKIVVGGDMVSTFVVLAKIDDTNSCVF